MSKNNIKETFIRSIHTIDQSLTDIEINLHNIKKSGYNTKDLESVFNELKLKIDKNLIPFIQAHLKKD